MQSGVRLLSPELRIVVRRGHSPRHCRVAAVGRPLPDAVGPQRAPCTPFPL